MKAHTFKDTYGTAKNMTFTRVSKPTAKKAFKRGAQYYQISVNSYTESKKAKTRYNYLIRKAKKEEL